MSSFFDLIDKYKFGLIAALATYVAIFLYLQISSYEEQIIYEPFHNGAVVDVPEDIELKADNIEVPQNNGGDVKNIARNADDQRERSYDNYDVYTSQADIDAKYRELEEQMYKESGGDKTRSQIKKEMQERKEAEMEQLKAAQQNNDRPAKTGGDKVYAGNVMVDWRLKDRDPHQKNNWFVRNPGYTCGHGAAGKVTVIIKVNNGGSVIQAAYDPSQSSGANQCMIDQAVKYAKMSRFSYSGSAPKSQAGRITYTFVSQ